VIFSADVSRAAVAAEPRARFQAILGLRLPPHGCSWCKAVTRRQASSRRRR
jgi:hypothetical protein